MTKTRYIPKGSTEIRHPQNLGVVYAYDVNGRPAAIAYAGKSNSNSWHHSFIGREPETERENRQKRIDEFFSSLTAHAELKAQRMAERSAAHTLQLGDVVRNTWGYDQTNVDFYEVVKTSANYVWLRLLKQTTKETGFMCGTTEPRLAEYVSDEVNQHRADSQNRVTFKYGCGSKWDGKPERCSWYA